MSVKQSRTIFKHSKDVYVLRVRIAQCSQVCAVKWSSNKNDSQNFLTLVTNVTTAPMGARLAGSETSWERPPPDLINFVPCHNTSTRDIVTTHYICTILVSLSCYIDQASPSPTTLLLVSRQ